MIDERYESELAVEGGSVLVQRMHDDDLESGVFGHTSARSECVGEEYCSEALSLHRPTHSEPSKKDRRDGILAGTRAEGTDEVFAMQAISLAGVIANYPSIVGIKRYAGQSVSGSPLLSRVELKPVVEVFFTTVEQLAPLLGAKGLDLPHAVNLQTSEDVAEPVEHRSVSMKCAGRHDALLCATDPQTGTAR